MAETDPGLARILARVAAWQAAADSYRAAMALERSAGGDAGGDVGRGGGPAIELPVGAFRGMTITDAIKLYLQSVRRKQTVQEIADGLRSGGLESTAKDFGPTLRGMLNRLKKSGELLRFKDGWDLAEAHSAALRGRLTKDAAKKPKTRKSAGKPKKPTTAKAKASAGPKGPTIDDRVQALLQAHPMDWFTRKHIGDALKETDARVVALALTRLVRFSRIAKGDDGRYAAVKK